MGGMVVGGYPGMPPTGTQFDPSTGGYVPIKSQVQITQNANIPYQEAYRSPKQAGAANQTAATNAQATSANYNVDPFGNTAYTSTAGTDTNRARLQAEAEARRMAMLQGLWSSGGGSAATVQHGGINSDEAAARAAAFARAKDQSGQIGASSLRGLQELMAARGISGSGIEALQSAGAVQNAQQPLQQLTRDQLMQDLNRSADISDLNYQGGITQRGQDLNSKQALFSLITQALY